MRAIAILPLLGLWACERGAPAPAPNPQNPAPEVSHAPVAEVSAPPTAPDAAPPRALPTWFAPTLFEGASVEKQARTASDDIGLYASILLLGLKDGTSLEQCVNGVMEKVGPHVPGLTAQPKNDQGSIEMHGENEDFKFVGVCGEGDRKMRAYLSLRWKNPEGE